ncbi:MAG: beta-galactosidase [Phycisphaerae bacterium]
MFLATQYYRPPFPEKRFWSDDISRMRDAGLDAVQLWAIWGWVESEPGVFRYDDYDELVALAEKKGLDVVLSTIAEIHPFWIHRLVPDAHLVDHNGQAVQSMPRGECNVGLTPGGCFDHPRIAEMMRRFLVDIASRYRDAGNLLAWDCWNETRWTVQAGGHTCYCPHTLASFRRWLDRRHGGLDGLNSAWRRRYVSWDDVYPNRKTHGTYVDMVEFLRFLADRAADHMRFRYQAIRSADAEHFISAHCGQPAIQSAGAAWEQSLCRGVDWDLADELDGFGCSHFPLWGEGIDEAGFGVRVESTRSANRGKETWVSELQGGSARSGLDAQRSVDPSAQQRWIAHAMARGAKGVIFWCWRDEVFGRESSGFGLTGWDGLAEPRLEAMQRTGTFIEKHCELIDAYRPQEARVGVLFVPEAYMLDWTEHGKAEQSVDAVNGCALALERLRVPYDFVEPHHIDELEHLKVLLMPWPLVLPDEARKRIARFIRNGGRVLVEAEADAYDTLGWYRYADERPFMRSLGISNIGRREVPDDKLLPAMIGDEAVDLPVSQFLTPLSVPRSAEVLCVDEHDRPLLVRKPVGEGAAWVAGAFFAESYRHKRNKGLERLIEAVLEDAGVKRDFDVDAGDGNELLTWRWGRSGKTRMLWVINGCESDRNVSIAGRPFGRSTRADELISGKRVDISRRRCELHLPAGASALLRWA